MTYTITRYEEKSDALFICINSDDKPVYIEHSFTDDERKDNKSRAETIERLIAELEVKSDQYVEPEQFISRLDDIAALDIKPVNVATLKQGILAERISKTASQLTPSDGTSL